MPVVDAAWEEWITTNVARGCSMDSMIDSMLQAGFAAGGRGLGLRANGSGRGA
ncbi:MAG: hypothetical protein CPDRYMAC_4945 [uncultured Paraburkholderia sp.]|nr:MAG: hypothetical protein CPDRYDRY_4918 [uncultured Paraburkholderia sp.]CAH2938861.1 MAG: hypothetical protein CPDRYMAC_4945 [uncultured Paraburkholderia sp.]